VASLRIRRSTATAPTLCRLSADNAELKDTPIERHHESRARSTPI